MKATEFSRERLGRVLGPAGPESTCEQCFELLDVCVELELGGGSADRAFPQLLAHLEGCPACREDHDSLVAYRISTNS
jgi:hypothetical protein